MITKVYDDNGDLVHDCKEIGCSVSWDGYALRDGTRVSGGLDAHGVERPDIVLAGGERVPKGADPDSSWWAVDGDTAHLRRNSV